LARLVRRGSFSTDKAQLEPLIKSGVAAKWRSVHQCDCVTFNRCAGSTKDFDYMHGRNIAANALDVLAVLEPMTPMSVRFSAALTGALNELSEGELCLISKSLAAQTFTCSRCFGP
jgi:hypothetical protein